MSEPVSECWSQREPCVECGECHGERERAEIAALRAERERLRVPQPRDAWTEEDGIVLWWTLPVREPPHVGSPLDDDFPDYVTHWTPIVEPEGTARDAKEESDVE